MSLSDQLRAAAHERAAALGADFVGTEHLFLAWLEQANGPIADAIAAAGLTPEAFLAILAQGKPPRRAPGQTGETGALSSHAERIMERSAERAQSVGRSETSWDDLVLALVHEPRGAIARALTAHALKPSRFKSLATDRPAKRAPAVPAADGTAPPVDAPVRERSRERKERPAAQVAPEAKEAAPRTERPAKGKGRAGRDPEIDDIPEARAPERPRLTLPLKTVLPPEPAPRFSPVWLLYLAIPAAIWLQMQQASPLIVFILACVGVLPLAGLMGQATEHLADRTGPAVGGLLNATFGNAAELIIALAALRHGHVALVKASITGSILGNLLLILGLSLIAGGTRASLLRFNRTNAGMSAAMLSLAAAGLIFPALFHATHSDAQLVTELAFSESVSVILILTYLCSLFFVLRTHRPLFGSGGHGGGPAQAWSVPRAVGALALATVGIAVMSEILVGAVEPVTASLGISEAFLGLIVIPIIGNAAEHATAVVVARKGNTDLAFQIALGSSTQVALLIAPLLVFAGAFMAVPGMNLVFSTFEVGALSVAVIVSAIITLDGESHWFEGVQLLALYAILGAAAWFI